MKKTQTFEMTRRPDGNKVHSVVFDSVDRTTPEGDKMPLTTVYLNKPFSSAVNRIRVTIEVLD